MSLESHIIRFIKEYQDINGTYVHVYPEPPSPLEFLRESVHPNRPAIIKNAIHHWPANKLWTNSYLRQKMGDHQVTVSVTPNGYADAVTYDPVTDREYFAMPHEQKMAFSEFLDIMEGRHRTDENTYYISLQNDSLHTEFGALLDDVEQADVPWCSEALGKSPDAVNFWMGNHKSVTSLHKDPYENCYAVVRGEKTFVLLPPTEYYCLHESVYPNAVYTPDSDSVLRLTPQPESSTPWIPVNPLAPDYTRYPRFKCAKPIVVTVHAGEMLYLPALWFHQVLQQGQDGVIAINAWYDMEYRNSLYPTLSLLRGLLTMEKEQEEEEEP